MGRLLGLAWTLLIYFCAATLVALALIAGYAASLWQVNGERLEKAVAAIRGIEAAASPATGPAAGPVAAEQVSFEEILERRALKSRDLELRELAVSQAAALLRIQEQQLAGEQEKLANRTDQFESQLSALSTGAQAEGRGAVQRILEGLKPAQAKEQIAAMLEKGEIDEVVLILSGMQEAKQAKILGEFKDPTERDKAADILRRIREGEPQKTIIDSAAALTPPLN